MALTRLFAFTLLVCALPAFAQDRSTNNLAPASMSRLDSTKSAAATPSEPWRIIPNWPAKPDSAQTPLTSEQAFAFNQGKVPLLPGDPKFGLRTGPLLLDSQGALDGDVTCLKIRSYVVARDSKDSESTHPVGYSTCQRASRYKLKTAEGHSVSLPVSAQR
jgi:hypothetical protein